MFHHTQVLLVTGGMPKVSAMTTELLVLDDSKSWRSYPTTELDAMDPYCVTIENEVICQHGEKEIRWSKWKPDSKSWKEVITKEIYEYDSASTKVPVNSEMLKNCVLQ